MKIKNITTCALTVALSGALALGQTTSGGWRKVTDPAAPTAPEPMAAPADESAAAPRVAMGPADAYGQSRDAYGQTRSAGPGQGQPPMGPPMQRQVEPATLPGQLTIAPGTFVTVRIDQMLTSDRNVPGDVFSATLVKPIVVDGFVVAQRGQTIAGHITEVQKAGRISGTSRLAFELSELTAVDGQQVRIHSQLVSMAGGTAKGRDAQAIGTTTALGAVAGAIADDGRGAAIGAGAGAAAGIIGVLLTRGHASVVYPESVLTFRIDTPVAISTVRAPQAFLMVNPQEYEREPQPRLQTRVVRPAPVYAAPYPYYGPGYYPYYWGPSVGLYWGRGWYGGRHYYGRRW